MSIMSNFIRTAALAALLALFASACCHLERENGECHEKGVKPGKRMVIKLPEYCNTPDGMCLLPDGGIVLSVPNVNDQTQPGGILKISKENKIEWFCRLPVDPSSGKVFPMGIVQGPSGDIYIADNQQFVDSNNKSRILRVRMQNGQPVSAAVMVSGLVIANGLAISNGYLYVTDSQMIPGSKPLVSGVFRFRLDEEGVEMKRPLDLDSHLAATMTTLNEKVLVGADGIEFDPDGNMYIGNFGDGVICKYEMGPNGKAKSRMVFCQSPKMKSSDGMHYRPASKELIVADYMNNAAHALAMDGSIRTLAINDDAKSLKDMTGPAETLPRGDDIIVSNMGMPFGPSKCTKFVRPARLIIFRYEKQKSEK
ncbi:MAG: hypothetical protein NTX50_14305 [Candidatus Sumerlaeota bacterium]|nr:hypothetical protein [Candidatus Sumerlaeota bacterium]